MPIQVSDSLRDILEADERPSLFTSFTEPPASRPYFRPLRETQIKALLEIAGGHYHLVYRGFHALLFVGAILLFVRAMRVETAGDAAAGAFALTVFVGLHTMAASIASTYPISHFLEVIVLALLAYNLTASKPGPVTTIALVLTFLVASLTLESGILVWVVVATAWWTGARGASRGAIGAVSVCLIALLAYRMSGGYSTRSADSAGFLFDRLEPSEIDARFGDAPAPFYAYNVTSSIASVLFSEPRAGVWVALRDSLAGDLEPYAAVAVLSSVGTTVLIVLALWAKRVTRADDLERQLFVTFGAVLVANAVLSYAYTKDEIMGIAGAFYALAVFAAVRRLLAGSVMRSIVATLLLATMLGVAAAGWAVRVEGLHYMLYIQAFKHRNDWIAPEELTSGSPRQQALASSIRREVIASRENPNPRLVPGWYSRWFEEAP